MSVHPAAPTSSNFHFWEQQLQGAMDKCIPPMHLIPIVVPVISIKTRYAYKLSTISQFLSAPSIKTWGWEQQLLIGVIETSYLMVRLFHELNPAPVTPTFLIKPMNLGPEIE